MDLQALEGLRSSEVGHRALLVATLARAAKDLVDGDPVEMAGTECGCDGFSTHRGLCPRGRNFAIVPVRKWVEGCSTDPWGFGWVCHMLGYDPGVMRAGFLAKGG